MSDKGGRFFLDANVFLYRFDVVSVGKAAAAEELLTHAIASRRGVISYQVIHEFTNVAIKRLTPPLTTAELERHLTYAFLPMQIVPSSPALVIEALHLRERYQLSWYDSLLVSAALQAQCARLFTEDLQHGQSFGKLTIENPFLQQSDS
ncbi:MAG TPA: PIN domain-containing protein [Acidisarcina sp.]